MCALPLWYLVSRWGLGPKICMHHFGCGMNWIKGYFMIVKVKNETFWFSTSSMEMHSLTSSSFIICLWGETFGSRTILLSFLDIFDLLNQNRNDASVFMLSVLRFGWKCILAKKLVFKHISKIIFTKFSLSIHIDNNFLNTIFADSTTYLLCSVPKSTLLT